MTINKMIKKYLINEGDYKSIIYTNKKDQLDPKKVKRVTVFIEKEQEMIMKSLTNHKQSDSELKDFIDSVEGSEKSSKSLKMNMKGLDFSLYANNGNLRMGGVDDIPLIYKIKAKEIVDGINNSLVKK